MVAIWRNSGVIRLGLRHITRNGGEAKGLFCIVTYGYFRLLINKMVPERGHNRPVNTGFLLAVA
jgi:hypothetical protein